MKYFLCFTSLILLFTVAAMLPVRTVYAAPAPRGIAINKGTNECGGFWGGDEFVYIKLPAGWQSFYSQPREGSRSDEIATPWGSCIFASGMEKSCCEKLGFTYAGENIGIRPSGKVTPMVTLPPALGGLAGTMPLALAGAGICCICLLIAGGVGLFIKKRSRPK